MQPCSFFSSSTSEERWVKHVVRNYTINLDTTPCIFQVPQKLRNENPEAYIPRTVGLGPYHHLRSELQEMESQKRSSAKAFLDVEDIKILKEFVDEVRSNLDEENSPIIFLPHYDTYLDLESKTLAWILLVDSIFLLQFLKHKSKWEDQRMAAEIMMLENQIPFVLLEDIRAALKKKFPRALDITLLDQFNRFCDQLSPLRLCQVPERRDAAFLDKKHLLHYLYILIVENFTTEILSAQEGDQPVSSSSPLNGVDLRQAIREVAKFAKDGAQGVLSALGKAKAYGLKVPGAISNASKQLEQLANASDFYNRDANFQHGLADKIDVLSVSQLYHIVSIKFSCTYGGIRNILFDDSTNTLFLPETKLGETSEVVLRNLVAYEAASKPAGSKLELAEYVDLMCGIIKAENDVKLLRQFDIIKGNLPDEQIVRIFNGINKITQIPPEQSEIQRIVQKLWKLFLQEASDYENDEENDNQNRLANKIKLPSASELHGSAKLKFTRTDGGKRNILFDKQKKTLFLPEIKLGNTREEARKNLAAYEPEYVDFMHAIIDNEDDAELLKNIGIIKGDLIEEDIVDAFEEIGKSVQWPNELSVVQEAVQKVNKKCRNSCIIKAYQSTKNIFAAFQIWIKRLFPTLVLMLLFVQSFCDIYGCRARRSGYASVPAGASRSSFGLDNSDAKLMMPRKILGYERNVM